MALVADIDWVATASMTSAVATLVVALATFSSVRSNSRMARAAEQSLKAGLWPLLAPSRADDPSLHALFLDEHPVEIPGGQAVTEVTEDVIYLSMTVRNVGAGLAFLDGWWLADDQVEGLEHTDPARFQHVARDHTIPSGELGVWQGTLRDPSAPEFHAAAQALSARRSLTLEVMYGDHLGAQRTISRFALHPRDDGRWSVTLSRHWDLHRPRPRHQGGTSAV